MAATLARAAATPRGPSSAPSVGPVGGAVAQAGPQLENGLGVDLAHPALGHAQDLADLRQGQTFVVVQRQDGPLPVTELHDGLGEDLLGLLVLEHRHRSGGGVGDGVAERGPLAAVAAHQEHLVEGGHTHEGDLAQDVLEVVLRHVELGRDLGVGGRPQQRGLERGVGLLHRACLGPDRAWHPVDGPQLVDDGAPDPGDGIGLELDLAGRARTGRWRRSAR